MSSIKGARQRQKVKRVGIHAAFTPEGKERSEKEIEAYKKGNKYRSQGKKDNTKQRQRLDSAIERMSRGQTTDSNN